MHNHFLDWFGPGPSKHPVFGKVTSGMDIVNKIGVCETDGNDCPVTPVKMNKITIMDGARIFRRRALTGAALCTTERGPMHS